MLRFIRNNLRAVVLAVLVHIALIAMLVISLDWTPKPQPADAQDAVVQATVVDDGPRKAAQQQKEEAERKRLAALEAEKQEREDEQKRAAEAEAQRVAEELKQQALTEQEKIRQEQQAVEQKRLETAKREAAVKEKQVEEAKRQAEQVKREEEKRLAAVEAQRKIDSKIDTEKKRKAEKEAQQRKEAEQQLKDQLASEEQATSEQQAQTLISQYIPLIQNRVKSRWLPPPNAQPGMSCTVTVRLIPGGEVVEARVTTSSGDPVFDRSVESAVYKASPLPLPPDPALFEYFRELNFIFKP